MPTFEVEINGKVHEVDAPDLKTAASAAQQYQVQQHPWNRFNRAARGFDVKPAQDASVLEGAKVEKTNFTAPRMPVGGQNYPDNGFGSTYMPTNTENAKDLAMLAAMIGIGPLAQAAAPAYPILAPAVARTGVAMAPDMLTGDVEGALKKGAATAGTEALFSALGLPGRFWSAYKAKGVPQPALHQAANFEPAPKLFDAYGKELAVAPKPITFQRPTGGNVTVEPPTGGRPITGGSSPAAILQEPITKAGGGFEAGQVARTAGDVYAGENPNHALGALALILDKVKGLNPFRAENPASGAGRY